MRGFALPLEYFYKGHIEIKESYDDPDIGKERDIKAMLSKLKQFYDSDIMVEPNKDSSGESTPGKQNILENVSNLVACAHNTESENELSIAATVITEQLDELIDKITSEYSFKSQSNLCNKVSSTTHSSKKSNHLIKRMQSVTDIKALLKNSCSRVASLKAVNNEYENFDFSELDDGPQGKGSCNDFSPIKKLLKNLNPNYGIRRDDDQSRKDIMMATSKIISFINQKEKEYINEVLL